MASLSQTLTLSQVAITSPGNAFPGPYQLWSRRIHCPASLTSISPCSLLTADCCPVTVCPREPPGSCKRPRADPEEAWEQPLPVKAELSPSVHLSFLARPPLPHPWSAAYLPKTLKSEKDLVWESFKTIWYWLHTAPTAKLTPNAYENSSLPAC